MGLQLSFFLSEAIIGMRRSSLMTLISIATVTVSLLVFGFFLVMTLNLNNLAAIISSKMEIRVFLNNSLTQQEIVDFERRLRKIQGIKKIKFIDKDEAWVDFKDNFQNLNLNTFMRENPLPHSFRLTLRQNGTIESIASYIKTFEAEVDDVVYGGEIAKRMEMFSRVSKWGGAILVSLLGFSTLLIIVNTIRLTVIARQEEITIMRLVGATDQFIKGPFLIEGCVIGLLGASLAIVLLKISYELGAAKLQASIPFFPLVFQASQLTSVYISVGVCGVLLGVLGAYISVSRTLKKQGA